jgi:hypothetical protein
MARLEGAISLSGLPPHRGLILNLCFFAVPTAEAPAPHDGDPPADAATDCEKLFERVDLESESQETTFEHEFRVERPAGYYFLQVRAILFRIEGGRVFAQAEQFFFGRRPVHISTQPKELVTLPVSWPTQALKELGSYGVLKPKGKRPWWKLW